MLLLLLALDVLRVSTVYRYKGDIVSCDGFK